MREFRASDGIRIAFRDEGSGPPLLCLPGLTRDGRDFDYLMPHLAGWRVIRPDYRGRGGSDWADPASYIVPREARDLLELLDFLEIRQIPAIGTSRGGLIAMFLAATAKERLKGVLLNDVGPVIEPAGLEAIKGHVGLPPKFATRAEMAAAMPGLNPDFHGVAAERWAEEVKRRTTVTDAGLGLTYDPALRVSVLAAMAQPAGDAWPLFDALAGLPLALIHGANSNLLSAATVAEMRRRRPDMPVADVPGRGHVPFLDEPESLAVIEAWLAMVR